MGMKRTAASRGRLRPVWNPLLVPAYVLCGRAWASSTDGAPAALYGSRRWRGQMW